MRKALKLGAAMRTLDVSTQGEVALVPRCEWFLLCASPAAGLADAGPLGLKPVCQHCADKLALDLRPLP